MNSFDPQSALREWRAHMRHPVTGLALSGAGAIMGIAGPFGTEAVLPMVPRIAYWLVVCFATYGAASLAAEMTSQALRGRAMVLRSGLTGFAVCCAVSIVVLTVNYLVFNWVPDAVDLPAFLGTIFAVSLIITFGLHLAQRHLPQPPNTAPDSGTDTATDAAPTPPALLDRLPLDKRGALIAVSVEDHYVRVRTTKGEELILLRLSDALRELGDTPGAQVHRSHWVAWDHVTAAQRTGDRAILTLTGGIEIPASRANLPKLKEAGLLPR